MRKLDSEKILEWKNRAGHNRLGSELSYEVRQLRLEWEENEKNLPYFSDFIPMRLVTIIEVFVREAIRELVDQGPPFLSRAKGILGSTKIDFLFAQNLHGQKLSVGDIVAHSVSVNRIESIIFIFETLVPNFVGDLKKSHSRWTEDVQSWPFPPIIKDYSTMMNTLTTMFEARHILTHEIPHEKPYDINSIDSFLLNTQEFIAATDWLMVANLRGSVPRTQAAMNIFAGDQLGHSMERMEAVLKRLNANAGIKRKLLEKSQSKWLEFADNEADLRASEVEGGSMYPLIWASAKEEMVEQRIISLQELLDREEGEW